MVFGYRRPATSDAKLAKGGDVAGSPPSVLMGITMRSMTVFRCFELTRDLLRIITRKSWPRDVGLFYFSVVSSLSLAQTDSYIALKNELWALLVGRRSAARSPR